MFREDFSRNFGIILHDVARLLRLSYDRRMKSLGLTRSQWWVLTQLYRNDRVTQSELAQILEIDKPSLGRLLDRMESSGWLTREEDEKDRRAKRVLLTKEVGPAMKAAAIAFNAKICSCMGCCDDPGGKRCKTNAKARKSPLEPEGNANALLGISQRARNEAK